MSRTMDVLKAMSCLANDVEPLCTYCHMAPAQKAGVCARVCVCVCGVCVCVCVCARARYVSCVRCVCVMCLRVYVCICVYVYMCVYVCVLSVCA